jgi:RND family efflux transporter MFP subunit
MSTLKQIAAVAALFLAAVAAWYVVQGRLPFTAADTVGPTERSAGADAPAVPVLVAPVRMAENRTLVRAVGTGEAAQTVSIYPRTAGNIVEVGFAPGDRVEGGQMLIRLDDDEEKLAVRLAEVRIRDAQQLLRRYERAVRGGGVSASEVDTARTTLEEARIQLAQAEVALERRTVEAPFDGVVGFSDVERGDRATETTLITTLDDPSAILIDFDVPEAVAGRVEPGDAVTATTWSFPGEPFTGTVTAVGSRIDPETRSLRTRARISNPDDRLDLPGEILPSMPEIALQWGREGSYVWTVRDGKVEREPVVVRRRTGGRVLAEAELTDDDVVVIEGTMRLRDGLAVDAAALDATGGAAPRPADSSPDDSRPAVREGS